MFFEIYDLNNLKIVKTFEVFLPGGKLTYTLVDVIENL